jgi:hypothetical protein
LSQTQSSQAANIAKKVMLRNIETKRNMRAFNFNLGTNGFQAWNMSIIAQGDDINQRNGRQILATSLRRNFFLRNNSFLEPILVRMLVLQAKEGQREDIVSSTALFSPSLLPDDNTTTWDEHNGQGKIQAILKPIDTTKWIVKEDKRFTLGALPNPDKNVEHETAASTGRMSYHDGRSASSITRSILNLKGRKIHYDGSGSCEDRLHIVLMCCQIDGSQILGSTMSVVGNACLYFKDP